MNSQAVKNILLIQLFSNGDCLYATTVARQIKNDFPGSKLTWAIAGFCKDIVAGNPYVDEIMEVNEVAKNDIVKFRRFKRKMLTEKLNGIWDEVFVTQNMDKNQALYDGTIRGMIFRAYPLPIIVPVQPTLMLTEKETIKVADFATRHNLRQFRKVILWEYAPQSGQSAIRFDFVIRLALRIINLSSTCIILSSASPFPSTEKIIDASELSVRENAALTHYCSLLIGCSSGITWLSTSSAAKALPMVQLLNPFTPFINAPSVDFNRYNIPTENLIEIIDINEEVVYQCIYTILEKDFEEAKRIFNEALPIQFNTTRKIVYNMLCYLQFKAIARHYKIMISLYGKHPEFLKQFLLAIFTFPFKLVKNIIVKNSPFLFKRT